LKGVRGSFLDFSEKHLFRFFDRENKEKMPFLGSLPKMASFPEKIPTRTSSRSQFNAQSRSKFAATTNLIPSSLENRDFDRCPTSPGRAPTSTSSGTRHSKALKELKRLNVV